MVHKEDSITKLMVRDGTVNYQDLLALLVIGHEES